MLHISVRALVEYVYLSGSIESGFRTSRTLKEGTKAHQKIQKNYGELDHKEVYLKTEVKHGDIMFAIEGRCDGLLIEEETMIIDEIKSTSREITSIAIDSYPVHWAQAKCYAYMYAKANGVDHMLVQLTYVHVETEDVKRFRHDFTISELESFIDGLVQRYFPYASLKLSHEHKRNKSIKDLTFPFGTYREGQRKFAGAVYKTIADSRRLFAKAPTGTGKTISTLFPSIKAIGEGLLQRMFYITAKTITRTAAEEAFSLMESQGLCLQSVTLTAKEKICFKEEVRCQKEFCEYADGYYDRINGAILDMLSHEQLMTRQVIESYAQKHRVCPFEFSLDASYAVDAVICDYNYVFDPRVSLKRLFEEHKKQTVILVDEAHNLVDRAREMYSAELNKSDFLALKRLFKGGRPAIHDAAKAVNDYFIQFNKESTGLQEIVFEDLPETLIEKLEAFVEQAERELLLGSENSATSEILLDTYFTTQSFIRIAGIYDERYVTYAELSKSETRMKLLCLDPSFQLQQMGKGYRSILYFSATLSPLSFFIDMLGGDREADYTMSIPSPFAREQLDVLVQPLSTRYRDREATKEPIVKLLHRLLKERPGNYLVFFPSYEYMSLVYERFMEEERSGKIETLLQHVRMTEEERESFLGAFQEERREAFIGFAVMGGMFSEGIDLKGDRLIGVVVIGVGLPQLGYERNIIKDYFNRIGNNGYDYAYVYPGMNKVLQAGGRLIRSEEDHGTLVLVDDRYLHPQYERLLPLEWKPYKVIRQEEDNIMNKQEL